MKKNSKTFGMVALILLMVIINVTISDIHVSAAAESSGSITIRPNGQSTEMGNRFYAYQIFKGVIGKNKEELDNLEWGSGVEPIALIEAMKSSPLVLHDISHQGETFGNVFSKAWGEWKTGFNNELSEAEFVAQWLAEHLNISEYADDFARIVAACTKDVSGISVVENGNWVIKSLNPGYYLVIDKYLSSSDGDDINNPDEAASSYILEVLGNTEVDLKATVPTVEKKVEGQDGYLAGTDEVVHFTLTGTISENIDEYDTYYYQFIDTLSPGLEILDEDLKMLTVELVYNSSSHKAFTVDADESECFKVELNDNILTVTFKDLKSAINSIDVLNLSNPDVVTNIKIVVSYTAHLSKSALIGQSGNSNDVKLIYSNNPYNDGKGESVSDEVKTYSLALEIHKKNENNEPLKDVKFKLKKMIPNSGVSPETWQYATASDFTGNDSMESPDKDKKYVVIIGWVDNAENGYVFVTDEDGNLHIHGLELGTYMLEETETSAGYELMKPVTFTIEANSADGDIDGDGVVDNNGQLSGKITIDKDSLTDNRQDVTWNNGQFGMHNAQMTLRNFPSPILPHTGGIGAGVVVGISIIILLIGGVIILIAFKSRNHHDKTNL